MTVPAFWVRGAVDDVSGPDEVSYDADAAASVLPVSVALAGVFVAMLVLHPVAFGQASGAVTTVVTVAGLIACAVVAVVARRVGIPPERAHAVLLGLTVVCTAAATAHVDESGSAQESVAFLLLVVAIGAVMLQRTWFLVAVAVVWGGWTADVASLGGTPREWSQWMFYLAIATALGVVVNLLRRRSLDIAAVALDRAVRAATEDVMTGLSNRRGLALLGTELVALGRRQSDAVHCSFLDVDGLKAVNDRYGHDEGDRVILEVSHAIRAVSRDTDVVARWGGDEFVVVGLGVGVPPLDLERRVADRVARENPSDAALAHVRISVGRAMLEPWDSGDLERLLWLADKDMYVRRERQRRGIPPVVTLDRTTPSPDDRAL
jgi:diguanylate cyclase (GGDEF)-like protein